MTAGLWLTFFGGLVAFDRMQSDAFALPKLVCITAGLWGLWAWKRGKARRTHIDGPVWALVAVALASAAFSGDWPTAVFGIYRQPFHGLVQMAACVLAFYAAARGGAHLVEQAFTPVAAALLAMGGFAVAQRLGFVAPPWDAVGVRVISTSGSPVFFGAVLAVAAPLTLHGWEFGGRLRWLYAAALCAVAVALPLTEARGAMIATACGLGAYLVMTRRVPARAALAALAVAGVLVVGVVGLKAAKGAGDSQRVELWKTAGRAALARPLLGYGPDCFANALRRHRNARFVEVNGNPGLIQAGAHNDLAQVAATLGLLGLAVWLWLLAGVAREVLRAWFTTEFFATLITSRYFSLHAAAIGSVVAAFVVAKVNPVPLEAMVLVAFMAGRLCSTDKPVRGWTLPFAASSLALVVVASWLCVADLALGRGVTLYNLGFKNLSLPEVKAGADRVRAANTIAPWEVEYAARRCDAIFILAPMVNPHEAQEFMKRALRVSAAMVARRPNNSQAHEMMATAALKASFWLGPFLLRDAHRAILRAQELDPLFTPTQLRRAEIEAAMARVKR